MPAPLTLADVVFHGHEVPETIEGLGNTQYIEVHDFPGGKRTMQTYGAFPSNISWKGFLTGSIAFDRAIELDRIAVSGALVPLSYGPWSYLGLLHKFDPRPKHQWLIPYSLTFIPLTDLGVAASANLPPAAEAALDQMLNNISALANPINTLMETNPLLVTMLQAITVSVGSAIANAGGSVGNIAPTDTAAALVTTEAFLAAAGAFTGIADDTIVSPTLDAIAAVTIIQSTLQQPTLVSRQVQCINPNLGQLAQQYYGDASQWPTIANANGLLDPQPIGAYTLNIPAPANSR